MAEQTERATAPNTADDDAKRALAWTHTARFLTTSSRLDQLPVNELPEIAFVGRSNAGKSTAINTLTQHKRRAFASAGFRLDQSVNAFSPRTWAVGRRDKGWPFCNR